MRKILFSVLSLSLLFVACSNLEGPSGIGRMSTSPMCASTSPPWIGLDTLATPTLVSTSESADPVLRAVTYNIHAGMGEWKSFRSSRATVERHLDAIAADIVDVSSVPVDIVALNEVDFMARRSGGIDQARYLADALQRKTGARYDVVYGKTRQRTFPGFEGGYGNAVLVRHAVANQRACLYDDTRACEISAASPDMPSLRASALLQRVVREARGVIKLTLDFNGRPLDVIVTHLEAVALQEREAQAAHLVRRFVDPTRTTVMLGDMNAVPTFMTGVRSYAMSDRTHDILTSGSLADARVLYDARLGRTDFRAWATYPAKLPVWPLDMALGSLDLIPEDIQVMSAINSDHRGFYVAYRVSSSEPQTRVQRAQHDMIRQRQLAQILQCDISGTTREAKLKWLRQGTQFFSLFPNEAQVLSVSTPAL